MKTTITLEPCPEVYAISATLKRLQLQHQRDFPAYHANFSSLITACGVPLHINFSLDKDGNVVLSIGQLIREEIA
jgi:hypothetical protein